MTRLKTGLSLAFIALLATSTGCASKVRYEKTATMAGGSELEITVDGPKKEQKVKVEISATEEVAVQIILEKNKGGKGEPLAAKSTVKNETFEVTIPAGENFMIILHSNKTTDVTVKANSI